jgi:hypothetical protein
MSIPSAQKKRTGTPKSRTGCKICRSVKKMPIGNVTIVASLCPIQFQNTRGHEMFYSFVAYSSKRISGWIEMTVWQEMML